MLMNVTSQPFRPWPFLRRSPQLSQPSQPPLSQAEYHLKRKAMGSAIVLFVSVSTAGVTELAMDGALGAADCELAVAKLE